MSLFRQATATRRARVITGVVVVLAIPVIALVWWLASPLFLNKTVDEEFPRTAAATLPDDMTREEAEGILAAAEATTETTEEDMTSEMEATETVAVKAGSFRDEDSVHHGSGTATVYSLGDGSNVLRLEDFDVTNGPDLFVLLTVDPEGRDTDQGYVNLGALKGNRGNQNYDIPSDVDISEYNAATIYCRAFSFVFSTAPLSATAT